MMQRMHHMGRVKSIDKPSEKAGSGALRNVLKEHKRKQTGQHIRVKDEKIKNACQRNKRLQKNRQENPVIEIVRVIEAHALGEIHHACMHEGERRVQD